MRWLWALAMLCACSSSDEAELRASEPEEPGVVRVAVVNTPARSGLLEKLLEGFEEEHSLLVQVWSGEEVFERAVAGEADLVIAHYGKHGTSEFVQAGHGRWPRIVFANQAALIGPASDPAGIRGMTSASEALQRVAQSPAPFASNALPGISFLTELLARRGALDPDGDWMLQTQVASSRTAEAAAEADAYFIWGAVPFLRWEQRHGAGMEILVWEDPAFQRVMASMVVEPSKVAGVNAEGAEVLQRWLLSAEVQARVAAFRQPEFDGQLWWPAARNN